MIGDKKEQVFVTDILKMGMVIYTHNTYIHLPHLNLVPQKCSRTMCNFKMSCNFLSWQYSFTDLNSQTPACHKTNMHEVSYFVLALLILTS